MKIVFLIATTIQLRINASHPLKFNTKLKNLQGDCCKIVLSVCHLFPAARKSMAAWYAFHYSLFGMLQQSKTWFSTVLKEKTQVVNHSFWRLLANNRCQLASAQQSALRIKATQRRKFKIQIVVISCRKRFSTLNFLA